MLVTCAFNPLVELSGLPLAKAEMGVERELSASLGSGSYNLQDQNEDRDSAGIQTGRMFAVRGHPWKDVTSPDAVSLVETVQWALQTCGW